MQRRRAVAAAPVRTAGESWSVIASLVADSLSRSPRIDRRDVSSTMEVAAGAGRMLIAGGHLDNQPLVVVAGTMHLSITTVSGDEAFTLEENLNPVPGAASADTWTVHLPAAEPLEAVVSSAASSSLHLSAEPPPADAEATSRAERNGDDRGGLIDFAALSRRPPEKS
jgi:hypothetical protein